MKRRIKIRVSVVILIISIVLVSLLTGCLTENDIIDYTNGYYEELSVPASEMGSLLNAESATASNCQSGFVFLFVDEALAVDEKIVYATFQMPHDYAEGTDIIPCIHFVFGTDQVGTCVRWRVSYSWANPGEDFVPGTTIWALSDPSNNDDLVHQTTKFAAIDGTGKGISSMLLCLISRNSSNASDNFTDTVSLVGMSMLYQKDSPGSTSEWSK